MLSNMTGVRASVAAGAIGVVAAQTVSVVNLAVTNAAVGDGAMVNFDALPANLMVGQPIVTAGQVAVPICNPTGGGIDAGSPTVRVQLIKGTGSV